MRRLLLASLVVFACDSKDSAPAKDAEPEAAAAVLPSVAEVCAAYKSIKLADNVFVLSATRRGYVDQAQLRPVGGAGRGPSLP